MIERADDMRTAAPTDRCLPFRLVDVFAAEPYTGNSLAVFPAASGLQSTQMLRITREMRHFESVFITARLSAREYSIRVFDQLRELPFAGHPLLGAAAVLHVAAEPTGRGDVPWQLNLPGRSVHVTTSTSGPGLVRAVLDQGEPEFGGAVPVAEHDRVAAAFGLAGGDLAIGLHPQVVSTGLRYLVVPIRAGLDRAGITADITDLLARYGAEFGYLLDVERREGRHWNNDGIVEDVATGSAAGVVGAYLVGHGVHPAGTELILRQGRFVDRPSQLRVVPYGSGTRVDRVVVGGEISLVGSGQLDALPAA